ncbi:MAG: C40 family peptidase [Campylobacterales bacterium]|nr:C40 family peptidase [Campylobacterales bacterium]
MSKTILTLLSLSLSLNASILIVKNQNGTITKSKTLTHKKNLFLTQKDREWDINALYRELFAQKIKAMRAKEAKERMERIAKAQEEAKAKGVEYKISAVDKAKLLEDAKYFKGGKYVWGGTNPEGFDCSGYVQYLYKKQNIDLPRTAYSQSKLGTTVAFNRLQKGDLVFFLTDKSRGIPITHVGIYIGEGKFIHAADKTRGVIVSPIMYGSYRKNFVTAKRLVQFKTEVSSS